MADLSVTENGVLAASTARTATGVLGATATAGQPVYKDSADGQKLKPCDANDSAMANCVGILLTGGGVDQPCSYVVSGNLDFGTAILTVGERYYVSETGGGIKPSADLLTPEYVSLLGIASTTQILIMSIINSGVQL